MSIFGDRGHDTHPRRGLFGLTPESDTFLHLDLMRFIASMRIVLVHFAPRLGLTHAQVDGMNAFVDVFFVISGIVISHVYHARIAQPGAFRAFLVARVARLVPLHVLATLAFVGIGLLSAMVGLAVNDADKYDLSCLPPSLLLTHAIIGCDKPVFNFVSWSISAEFAMYLLFPLLMAAGLWRRWLLVVLAAGFVALFSWADPGWWLRTYDHGVLRAIPAFLLGMGLHLYRAELGRIALPGWLFVPAVAGLVAAMTLVGAGLVVLGLSYGCVVLLFILDRRPETHSPLLRYLAPLGQLTYSIYMLHPLFHAIALALVAQRIAHLEGMALHLATLASLPVLIGVSYLSLVLFETPARRWIRARWGAPRDAGPAG